MFFLQKKKKRKEKKINKCLMMECYKRYNAGIYHVTGKELPIFFFLHQQLTEMKRARLYKLDSVNLLFIQGTEKRGQLQYPLVFF